MSALLAGPLLDPEAHEPTTPAMVGKALDNATVGSAEAQLRWREYLEALESNEDVGDVFASLEVAARQVRYAWSIYHSAVADAARDGWEPGQGATVTQLGAGLGSPR